MTTLEVSGKWERTATPHLWPAYIICPEECSSCSVSQFDAEAAESYWTDYRLLLAVSPPICLQLETFSSFSGLAVVSTAVQVAKECTKLYQI